MFNQCWCYLGLKLHLLIWPSSLCLFIPFWAHFDLIFFLRWADLEDVWLQSKHAFYFVYLLCGCMPQPYDMLQKMLWRDVARSLHSKCQKKLQISLGQYVYIVYQDLIHKHLITVALAAARLEFPSSSPMLPRTQGWRSHCKPICWFQTPTANFALKKHRGSTKG